MLLLIIGLMQLSAVIATDQTAQCRQNTVFIYILLVHLVWRGLLLHNWLHATLVNDSVDIVELHSAIARLIGKEYSEVRNNRAEDKWARFSEV